MILPLMADTARYFKSDPKGVENVCKSMEDRINAEDVEIALKMITKGRLTFEEIAEYSSLPLDEVKALAPIIVD